MAHDDEDADGQSVTSVSCRLCCTPSVAVGQRHPIITAAAAAATDDGGDGTRPGGRGLRDTIVKHLRIQVSEPFTTSVNGSPCSYCRYPQRVFPVAAVYGGEPTIITQPTVHRSTLSTPRPHLQHWIILILFYYQRTMIASPDNDIHLMRASACCVRNTDLNKWLKCSKFTFFLGLRDIPVFLTRLFSQVGDSGDIFSNHVLLMFLSLN